MGKQVKVEPDTPTKPFASKKPSKKVKSQPQEQQQPIAEPKVEPQQEQQTADAAKKKHNRIIIRNLVVDINEKHLRKLCGQFGEITDISIPKHGVKNCGRGFAFVEFTKKNMCRKAVKKLNQLVYKGRTIVVDLAVNKEAFQKANDDGTDTKMEVEQDAPTAEVKAQEQVEENKSSKPKKAKPQPIAASENTEEQKKEKTAEDLSQTVFVRNLPFSVTEDQLYKFLRPYGKMHFVKLVIDKETEEPKGTAFVKFRDAAVASKLMNYSRDYEQSLGAKATRRFEEDPTINLEIEGRIIKIFPAQNRTALTEKIEFRDKKKEDPNAKKPKALKKIKDLEDLVQLDRNNKRNLHLADEGICRPEPWMLRQDTEKFEHSQREKVEKLKNPNMFVSATRIILKYLDRTISEAQLKDTCHMFLTENHPTKHKLLTYCKLMLDEKREKSIGIAFVEFAKADLSLQFLRWVKDNRQRLFAQKTAVLAEFVIQDARKFEAIRKKIKKVK